jgi:2,4-dienoyl-CoA reductase-like NADH-dependent reductase (Old Yellow Enzyme family)
MGIHDDSTLPGLTQMTEVVHRHGGKIAVQLAHAGAQAAASLSGLDAMGPSVFHKNGTAICREMKKKILAVSYVLLAMLRVEPSVPVLMLSKSTRPMGTF